MMKGMVVLGGVLSLGLAFLNPKALIVQPTADGPSFGGGSGKNFRTKVKTLDGVELKRKKVHINYGEQEAFFVRDGQVEFETTPENFGFNLKLKTGQNNYHPVGVDFYGGKWEMKKDHIYKVELFEVIRRRPLFIPERTTTEFVWLIPDFEAPAIEGSV